MAEITRQIGFLAGPGAVLTQTIDDVTPLDPALIRFNLTCTGPVRIKVWRTSQIPWREFDLPPGSYQYDAGGPVQNLSDITYVYMMSL